MSTKDRVSSLAGRARDVASRVQTTVTEKAGELRGTAAATGAGAAVDERMRRVRLPGRRSQNTYDATRRAQQKSNRRVEQAERRLANAQRDLRRAREQAEGATASARRTSGTQREDEGEPSATLGALTKKELLERAGRLDIHGRSRMSKAQLVDALRRSGQA